MKLFPGFKEDNNVSQNSESQGKFTMDTPLETHLFNSWRNKLFPSVVPTYVLKIKWDLFPVLL